MFRAPVSDGNNISEQELLQRVLAGDRAAFKQVYDTHATQILNLCLRLVGNRNDAEEITQDVFLAFWKHASTIRGESKLSTWLYRVAVNRTINFRKRGGIFSQIKQVLSLDPADDDLIDQLPTATSDRPDRQLEVKEAGVQLADLLARIPERQREAYLLHKLEGLSYKEIAQELNITLATVESLIHRAKGKLQNAMVKRYKKGASGKK